MIWEHGKLRKLDVWVSSGRSVSSISEQDMAALLDFSISICILAVKLEHSGNFDGYRPQQCQNSGRVLRLKTVHKEGVNGGWAW